MNILPSLIRSHHFLSPATLISDNSAVSVLTSILKQPLAYHRCLYCPLCDRLQQIQNCLARTVVTAPKSSLVTPILRSLHWLKINERIEYKLLSLTYNVLTTSQPDYLHNLISVQSSGRTRSSFCCHPSSTICIFVLRHYKSPTAPLDMHHLTFGINSRQPHCVHSPSGSPHPTYITSPQSSPSF